MPQPDSTTEEYDLKIKILSQKHNPLLKRKEVVFEVDHTQEGQTSSRLELRKNLANALKTKYALVFVEKVKTKTGTMTAIGEAHAYETPEQAKLIECQHIMTRNIPPEKPAEAEKPKTEALEEKSLIKEAKPEEAGEPKKETEDTKPDSKPRKTKEEEKKEKEE